MLVSSQQDKRNQIQATVAAASVAAIGLGLTFLSSGWLLMLPIAAGVYFLWRRKTTRRRRAQSRDFPQAWQSALSTHVEFFRVLSEEDQSRFKKLMQVFLAEVAVTGIRTDVDETTRALVAASAVIPIFGFDDWEYSGLGEVLIYPSAYGENFRTDGLEDRNILGMVGAGHLSGVMILSKPDLIAGFDISSDKRNVGIHEFSHLVDKADGAIDGLPAGIPVEVVKPWIDWVGRELKDDKATQIHIDDYAYTNEAEYFAVLSEYFFESPAMLEKKNPGLYAMLEKIYRQNPKQLLGRPPRRRRRIGRNDPCPCGSGEKFKRCCKG
jgi:Mlc titration factor MtfA (ptsG expression regulator)